MTLLAVASIGINSASLIVGWQLVLMRDAARVERGLSDAQLSELAGIQRQAQTLVRRCVSIVDPGAADSCDSMFIGSSVRASDLLFLVLVTAVSLTLSGAAALIIAKRLSRPISDVAAAAGLVADGRRSVRVDTAAKGEIADLVDRFNRMAAEIDGLERERGVLTAGIAHELRTPLTILKARLHAILDDAVPLDRDEADRLLRQVDQLSRLIDDLRTLAHADARQLALDARFVDLKVLADTVIADCADAAEDAGVRISGDRSTVTVRGDPLRLCQVTMNLLTNAIKHAPRDSVVDVSLHAADAHAVLRVADAGPGFRAADGERLFMPFWRADAPDGAKRPGSGLGLALAKRFVELHGGTIRAGLREGGGAEFEVRLPRR